MRIAISSHKHWLILLLAAFIVVTPTVYAQDDFYDEDGGGHFDEDQGASWVSVKARGTTLKGAIARGWKTAMMKFLKENIDMEYYEGRNNEIRKHIAENWTQYCVGDQERPRITRRFNGRYLRMSVRLNEDALLRDIRNLVKKGDDKFEGMWVAIVSDREKNPYQDTNPAAKDENTDRDVMFDDIQNLLGKHMQIRDLRAIDRLMKKEAQMLGLAAGADPQAYIARKFAQVQLVVYLWLTTRRVSKDPAMGVPIWYATIGCRVVHLQTAQELVKFQLSSGDNGIKPVGVFGGLTERMARTAAIKNVAKAVYKRVYNQVRTRKTVLQENIYTIKFVNFNSRQERRIKDAMLDMKHGKRAYCDIEASTGGGSGYMEYKLKWRRTRDSQADIIDIIIGFCEDNEVEVDSNKSTTGVIYFEPMKDEDYGDF